MLASASRSRPGPRARARASSDPPRRARRGRSSNATRVPPIVTTTISTMRTNTTRRCEDHARRVHELRHPRGFQRTRCAWWVTRLPGFWPKKIPGTPAEYADVFQMLMPCLEESSSFEGALMVRVMAENIAERTRFRLMLKRRKAERLKAEAAERAAMERAVTAKQPARERFERDSIRRGAAELAARPRGVQTRDGPDDRGTHHASAEPEGGGGGVGRDQAPREHEVRVRFADGRRVGGSHGAARRGVAARGELVREAFGDGTVTLSRDDTADDDEEDDEEEELERVGDGMEGARHDGVGSDVPRRRAGDDGSTPKRRWLASHRLHHGAAEFLEACANEGHEVLVLGGPYRSAACVRTVLTHPACASIKRNGVERRRVKHPGRDERKDELDERSVGREGSRRRRRGGHRARARRRRGDARAEPAAVAPHRLQPVRARARGAFGAHGWIQARYASLGTGASQGQG